MKFLEKEMATTKCDHELKYEKRPGTDNEGGNYELYLTALFAVRLILDAAVQDVQMAPNVDKYGAFDDIVIRVQYKSGSAILYLLQLKHKKKVHGSIDFINKIKGEFSLEKYKDSYCKDIKERIAKGQLDDLLEGVELKDVVPCLFTNAVYSKDTSKIILNERESLSCKALPCSHPDFIGTTPGGYQIFEVHTERPSFVRFLRSYLFADYQRRMKKIEENYPKSEVSTVNKAGNLVKETLETKIQEEGMNFESTLISPGELRVELYNKEVESDLLKEILSEMSDYFCDEYKSAQELYEEYSSKCAEYSEFFQRFRFYSGQLNCRQVKAAITSRISASFGACTSEVVRKFIEYIQDYFQGNHLLVKQQIQRKLLELMVSPLHLEKDFEKRFQSFRMVTNLNDCEQKLMVSEHIQVALQGRQEIRWCDMVDSNFCRSQEPEFLLKHMGSVVQVGKILELKCENYIKREFKKVCLRRDIFEKSTNCIFIVSVSKNSDLKNHSQHELKITDLRYGQDLPNDFSSDSRNYVILIPNEGDVDNRAESLMKSINPNANAVHYLNEFNDDLLEWRGSRNNANSEYQKDFFSNCFFNQSSVEEKELLQYFKSTVNIISAEPGMGKSTVLDSLIQYCPPNKWVLKLNLNEWHDVLNRKLKELLRHPLQCIFGNSEVYNSLFIKRLFDYLEMRKAVMVFIDAFDEISPKYTEDVLNLISKLEHLGISTWVFTRPNLKECLEENFNTAAIEILPLRERDIKDYLVKNKKIHGPSLKYLLKHMMDILKTPLYLYMLQTVLSDMALRSNNMALTGNNLQVTDLYEKFIKNKCDIYYKKLGIDFERSCIEDVVLKPKKLIERHQLLSLLATVDEDILIRNEVASHSDFHRLLNKISKYQNNLGLVSVVCGNTPIFYHRTFAEFLTARWLSLNTNHKAFVYVYDHLKNAYVVQFWFNKIITREQPLHAAVVDRNLEEVRKLCSRTGLELCDSLKRTPLHLAMSCFRDQHFYGVTTSEFLEFKTTEIECKIMDEICEKFANTKSFVSQRDIFGSCWREYAASYNRLFFASCFWGCKALMMMYLTSNNFLSENKSDIEEGKKLLLLREHDCCRKLLETCKEFEDFKEIKSRLLENADSEVTYVLKYFLVKAEFFENLPEGTENKLITESINDLEAEETRLKLTGIRKNIIQRIEMVRKIQLTGCTPLCAAAFLGYLDSVQVLVNNSGTVNGNPGDAFIPLHYAVDGGNLDIITWLIEAGADVNQVDANGNVALNLLLKNYRNGSGNQLPSREKSGRLKIMQLLIDNGAKSNIRNGGGNSCFCLAAYYKDFEAVKLFIESRRVSVDYRDHNKKRTVLHHAIESNLDVGYFLGKGADVNIEVDGKTSLDLAFNENYLSWETVKLLVRKDANVTYTQKLRAFAPLICAVEENHLDVAEHLAKKQRDPTYAGDVNVSELWIALSIESLFILEMARNETCNYIRDLLIKNGKNETATVFSSAIEKCHKKFSKFLVANKFYVKREFLNKGLFFEKAVQTENWEVVKLFIEIGINVDHRDNNLEFTALHKAVQTDHLDYVKYFIGKGARVNLKVREQTSLDLALENERANWEMVRLLVESGANVNCRHNQKGYTPLHYAVEEDHLDMVKFLINKKADVLITDRSGMWTPLRLAHHLERREIMNFFEQRPV